MPDVLSVSFKSNWWSPPLSPSSGLHPPVCWVKPTTQQYFSPWRTLVFLRNWSMAEGREWPYPPRSGCRGNQVTVLTLHYTCLTNKMQAALIYKTMQITGRQTFHLKFQLGYTLHASDSYNRVCCRGNNLIISCMALYLFLICTSLFHFKPVYGPEFLLSNITSAKAAQKYLPINKL